MIVANRELSEEEIAFIEYSLIDKQVSVDVDNNNHVSISRSKLTKEEKSRRKLYRQKRNYLILLRIFAVIPFVLAGIVLLIAASFSNFAHGDINGMIEQISLVSQSSEIVSQQSIDSLREFAQIYNSRWIIIAVIFTVFAIITFIFSLLYWWKKDEYEKSLLIDS